MARARRPKNPEETTKIQKDIRPKGPIKYRVELNEEQKEAKRLILANQVIVLTGRAGSGKTMVAVLTALDMLFKKDVEKIYITRPAVTREEIGFLPGDINDKLDPFLIPIYDNLNKGYEEEKIKKLLADKKIDIAPIAYMRGRTIDDILIIDEAQNIDHKSLEMCLTRIGRNGKIIICGDSAQIDLKRDDYSGLDFVAYIANKIEGMIHFDLKSNHRHKIVEDIMKEFELQREEKAKNEAIERKKKLLFKD